jgi:hypothetical protein
MGEVVLIPDKPAILAELFEFSLDEIATLSAEPRPILALIAGEFPINRRRRGKIEVMKSEDELRRDPSVIWVDASIPGRLHYFRKNRDLKDFHAWDTTTGTEIDVRSGLAVEASEIEEWFDGFLAGQR